MIYIKCCKIEQKCHNKQQFPRALGKRNTKVALTFGHEIVLCLLSLATTFHLICTHGTGTPNFVDTLHGKESIQNCIKGQPCMDQFHIQLLLLPKLPCTNNYSYTYLMYSKVSLLKTKGLICLDKILPHNILCIIFLTNKEYY